MDFDYDMKLSEVFPNLQGTEMEIKELDLMVRTYTCLKRGYGTE